jgi:hypothetical protein
MEGQFLHKLSVGTGTGEALARGKWAKWGDLLGGFRGELN